MPGLKSATYKRVITTTAIILFYNLPAYNDCISKNEVSGFNKIEEEGRLTISIVQHGLKRSCDVDTDYAATSKK